MTPLKNSLVRLFVSTHRQENLWKQEKINNRMFYNLFLVFLFGQLFGPLQIASAPACVHTHNWSNTYSTKHSFLIDARPPAVCFPFKPLWLQIGRKCRQEGGKKKEQPKLLCTMGGKQQNPCVVGRSPCRPGPSPVCEYITLIGL